MKGLVLNGKPLFELKVAYNIGHLISDIRESSSTNEWCSDVLKQDNAQRKLINYIIKWLEQKARTTRDDDPYW